MKDKDAPSRVWIVGVVSQFVGLLLTYKMVENRSLLRGQAGWMMTIFVFLLLSSFWIYLDRQKGPQKEVVWNRVTPGWIIVMAFSAGGGYVLTQFNQVAHWLGR